MLGSFSLFSSYCKDIRPSLRLLKDGHSTLDGMIENALHLELVLVVGVPLGQVPELLCQVKTVRDVLRRDVVLSHLDTVVQIANLKGK